MQSKNIYIGKNSSVFKNAERKKSSENSLYLKALSINSGLWACLGILERHLRYCAEGRVILGILSL